MMIVITVCCFMPTEAHADAINIGFVAIAGILIIIPLTLFTVLVEGIFLAIGLRIPYRKTLFLLIIANLVSLAAGIPVKIFNSWMYYKILPRPLAPYFRQYPYAIALGSLVFFIVTLITEYAVIMIWTRKKKVKTAPLRLVGYVLIANIVTYSVLAPLHYFATKPIHDIRNFTDDSAWAEKPVTELLFINGKGNLCTVKTDGRTYKVLVPDVVKDYQYIPAGNILLYRNGSNDLCLFSENTGKPVECWKTHERFKMEHVATCRDGRYVAYLSKNTGRGMYELVLFDTQSKRSMKTGIYADPEDDEPKIAWGKDVTTLFILSNKTVKTIHIGDNMTAALSKDNVSDPSLEKVYGRFYSGGYWYSGRDWGAFFNHDADGEVDVWAISGLGSHMRVTKNESTIIVADNPGLLRAFNRGFGDVSILQNGNEVVFSDNRDIYLLDIDKRKVGHIAEGKDPITLTPKYELKLRDEK